MINSIKCLQIEKRGDMTTVVAVGDINQLPEECVSQVISFTTPRDACVSSAVSRAFRSAADSDATWKQFLPSDCAAILSGAVEPVEYASIKELYMRLSHHPVLINGGSMSFRIDKPSGAKCYMISARAMSIIWSHDPRYWAWVTLPESRFSECAQLNYVWWLEMRGKIDSRILTPHTTYTAYLVFKRIDQCSGFTYPLQNTAITMSGDVVSQHSVCLHPEERQRSRRARRETRTNVKLPTERGDGWMEIEMGEFYSGDGFDGEVDMSFKQVNCNYVKGGILVQGIQVRPKH